MLGQLQQGVSVLLSDFLVSSIYSLLGVKRKLLTSRTCIQICIQCIHDAELVMTQKLRLLRDWSVNNLSWSMLVSSRPPAHFDDIWRDHGITPWSRRPSRAHRSLALTHSLTPKFSQACVAWFWTFWRLRRAYLCFLPSGDLWWHTAAASGTRVCKLSSARAVRISTIGYGPDRPTHSGGPLRLGPFF